MAELRRRLVADTGGDEAGGLLDGGHLRPLQCTPDGVIEQSVPGVPARAFLASEPVCPQRIDLGSARARVGPAEDEAEMETQRHPDRLVLQAQPNCCQWERLQPRP